MTTGSCEDSNSKNLDEPRFVETTRDDSGICEDDVAPKVLIVLVLVEQCRLRRPEMVSDGKGGFSAIIRELRGKGCSYFTMIDLLYDQKQINKIKG